MPRKFSSCGASGSLCGLFLLRSAKSKVRLHEEGAHNAQLLNNHFQPKYFPQNPGGPLIAQQGVITSHRSVQCMLSWQRPHGRHLKKLIQISEIAATGSPPWKLQHPLLFVANITFLSTVSFPLHTFFSICVGERVQCTTPLN